MIRPSTPNDWEPLFILYSTIFRSYIEEIWGWDEDWQRARFTQDMESSVTSVVEFAGETVGYVQTETDTKRLYLRNIGLFPHVQGKGIGTGLVKGLQRQAADLGVPVALSVFRTNLRAREFYDRLGFEKTGETETHIEMEWRPA